ncbi:MAG: hypothetical protein QM726_16985 [Chitinophagaceae bacterium]
MLTREASNKLLKKIRYAIVFFMVALMLSGITAFPLETEMKWLLGFKNSMPAGLAAFLSTVYEGLQYTNLHYPMLAYGYDWLAFAHIVIALFFIGPLKDPVRNIWVIEWGMIACIAIIPLAFLAKPIRGIPIYWTLIDCSFGVFGIIPLYIVWKWIKRLENANVTNANVRK